MTSWKNEKSLNVSKVSDEDTHTNAFGPHNEERVRGGEEREDSVGEEKHRRLSRSVTPIRFHSLEI